MSFIDLSHTLKNDFNAYPGDPEFSLKKIFEEEEFYLSKLECSLHTGTHIDAPLHYIKRGNTVSDIKLDSNISSVTKIQYDTVRHKGEDCKRVFIDCLKTETSMFTEMLYWDTDELKIVRNSGRTSGLRFFGSDNAFYISGGAKVLIDNLGKGASGAAIEAMNMVLGTQPTMGLEI